MSLTVQYTPPKSVIPFFTSKKFVSLIVGPYGSTKTTAGLLKIAYHAKSIAPCARDGVRRSRVAVVRNTRQMLFDTTVPDFLKWFPDGEAGILEKTNSRFVLKFDDVECEVLFRGLDDANDVRRLLSLQLTFGVIDEFREVHKEIYKALAGRLGRYPDKNMVPPREEWGLDEKGNPVGGCVYEDGTSAKQLWGMSNPPDMDTFWEEILTNPPNNMHVTIQPSGVSPEADWVPLLDSGYYENLVELHAGDQAWIDIYVHAKFGTSLSGRPVFPSFTRSTHVAKETLNVLPTTLVIGIDAGLNPTAVITQQTHDGRVLVHDAITGQENGMGALRFIREKLKPLLTNKYAQHPMLLIIDPSAMNRAQTDERSVMDIFKGEGFTIKPARTNNVSPRIATVENYLTRTVNGNPAFLVSPTATLVIKALAGGYRYKVSTKGETDVTPAKDHPMSDVADALQYACLQHDAGGIYGSRLENKRREIKKVSYAWAV